jgi:hypothetical protein
MTPATDNAETLFRQLNGILGQVECFTAAIDNDLNALRDLLLIVETAEHLKAKIGGKTPGRYGVTMSLGIDLNRVSDAFEAAHWDDDAELTLGEHPL